MEQLFAELLISFTFFLFAAVLVTKLTEIVGGRFPKADKKNISIVIGLIVALYANFNLMNLVGIPFGWITNNQILILMANITGIIFSGLILSTGANGVHDLLSRLQKSKELKEAELTIYKEPEKTT